MQTVIAHATIHTGTEILENHTIIIENGKIKSIDPIENFGHESARTIDVAGKHIAPGLIDTHINGGEKYYFTQHPTEETIQDIYESSLALGTTHVLPCLITSPMENILKGIEVTRSYM